MAKQTQIEWREAEKGTLEGVGGQYNFVISAIDDVVALDIFEAGNANHDDAYVESLQAESIDEAKSMAEEYA